MRAEIFHTLEGPQEGVVPPPLSNDNLLINELVRDYLSYNGYVNALGVFMAESGQPNDGALDRGFIRDEVLIYVIYRVFFCSFRARAFPEQSNYLSIPVDRDRPAPPRAPFYIIHWS